MKKHSIIAEATRLHALLILTLLITVTAAEAQLPRIDSFSSQMLARSGRLRILGAHFGSRSAGSYVRIDSHNAIVTRWSDSQITAYVPEQSGPGSAAVQVVTPGGSSNVMPMTVTMRQQQGRVRWAFEADAEDLWWRPALATDGTIYVHGSEGFVFVLSPDGGLKWATEVNWYGYVPPAVGPDGTIYVGSIQHITALNPDGTRRWEFTDPGAQGIQSGPAVGPDSNIYFANDFGLGVLAFAKRTITMECVVLKKVDMS